MGTAIFILVGAGAISIIATYIGYRVGYRDGLDTWRMAYRKMCPAEAREHKELIERICADNNRRAVRRLPKRLAA